MTVIFITNDLMAGSKLRGAQAAGIPLAIVADTESATRRCHEERIPLVVLDLSVPSLDAGELVPRLRGVAHPPGAIVAFAPHVHTDRLAAAQAAGCDEVLTRGQFHAQVEALLARYVSLPEA